MLLALRESSVACCLAVVTGRACISAPLVLHNLRLHIIIGGRDLASWWEIHGEQVPPVLRVELERESARLVLVKQQTKALVTARHQELATTGADAAPGTAFICANADSVDQELPRRPEDQGHSLWTTFQRVQENVIRGGQAGGSSRGRRVQTRPVGSIDRGVS